MLPNDKGRKEKMKKQEKRIGRKGLKKFAASYPAF